MKWPDDGKCKGWFADFFRCLCFFAKYHPFVICTMITSSDSQLFSAEVLLVVLPFFSLFVSFVFSGERPGWKLGSLSIIRLRGRWMAGDLR